MRYRLLAALLLAIVAVPGIASANGPSGSSENKKTHQVKCSGGTATPAGKIFIGSSGIESCSDDNSQPDGRIIASSEGYIAADGDPTNASSGADGFIRLDSSGPSCSDAKHQDATAGKGGSCG